GGFYAIVDPAHCGGHPPVTVAQQLVSGGAAVLQLRMKIGSDRERVTLARALRELTRAARVPFVMNDRADLALLPETNKIELVRAADEVLCLPKDRLRAAGTGGTSGIPFTFYRDPRCLLFRRAVDYTTFRYYGWRAGQWQGWLWGAPRDLVAPATARGRLLQRWAVRTFFADVTRLGTESYRSFAALARRYRPTWLSAYPSLAYDLAAAIEAGDIEPFRVPMVNLTAEPVYDFQKQLIRATFGEEVCERYGSREMGLAALECPAHNGLHYFMESVYFESIDRGPGSPGRSLVVTDLVNRGMPFIRYDTGDFARLDDAPCTCGRTTPRLIDIRGRETDNIWCPDGHGIAGAIVVYLFARINPGVPMQLMQESLDRIVIRIAGRPGELAGRAAELIDVCRREISPDIAYTIEYVDHIERAPSGKYRYIISRVPPPSRRR
nr:thiamine phosphate synthase [candidate division Zixibacteria bacterium]